MVIAYCLINLEDFYRIDCICNAALHAVVLSDPATNRA